MSGENRIILSEITKSEKKGDALVKDLNKFNTEAATKDDCGKK